MKFISLFFTPILICLLICSVICRFSVLAIFLSRIVFSLFLALTLNAQVPLLEGGGILGYGVWLVIIAAVMLFFKLFPKIDCALKFFCTSVVSYFIVEIVVLSVQSIIFTFMSKELEPLLWVEIIIKVFCILSSLIALISEIASLSEKEKFNNTIILFVERTIASLIYAISVFIIFAVSMNNIWKFSTWINIAILVGTFILTFIVDFLFFNKTKMFLREHQPAIEEFISKQINKPSLLSSIFSSNRTHSEKNTYYNENDDYNDSSQNDDYWDWRSREDEWAQIQDDEYKAQQERFNDWYEKNYGD